MITMGTSELPVACGVQRTHLDGTPYTSGITLWARLLGWIPRYDTTTSPDAECGRWFEVGVGNRFAHEHGLVWTRDIGPGPALANEPWKHGDLPWLHTRPDFVAGVHWEPVEVKCPLVLDPARWGETGTSDMPPDHTVQLVGQLAILSRWRGAEQGYLAAMARAPHNRGGGGRVFAWYRMARDEVLERAVLSKARDWLDRYVVTETTPPADGSEDADRTLRAIWQPVTDKVLTASTAELELYRRAMQTRTARDEIEGRHRELRQQLQTAMADHTALADEHGNHLVRWRVGRDGVRRFRFMRHGTEEADE
jgi:hypothetical protein